KSSISVKPDRRLDRNILPPNCQEYGNDRRGKQDPGYKLEVGRWAARGVWLPPFLIPSTITRCRKRPALWLIALDPVHAFVQRQPARSSVPAQVQLDAELHVPFCLSLSKRRINPA